MDRTTFNRRHWADLTEAPKQRPEPDDHVLRKARLEHRRQPQHGPPAATIVLDTLAAADRSPPQGEARLGRDALDHTLIWDERSIRCREGAWRLFAFGLTPSWEPARRAREEMLFAQYGDLSKVQPVKDLIGAGLERHFEGGMRASRRSGASSGSSPKRSVRDAELAAAARGRTASALRTWGPPADRSEGGAAEVTIAAARFIAKSRCLDRLKAAIRRSGRTERRLPAVRMRNSTASSRPSPSSAVRSSSRIALDKRDPHHTRTAHCGFPLRGSLRGDGNRIAC